jgi:hypothetical protein
MEKYYYPEMEDIHIGYECEIYDQASSKLIKDIRWHIIKVSAGNSEPGKTVAINKVSNYLKRERLRAPFLTKEDIISEGWKLSCNFAEYINEFKNNEFYCFEKGEYEIRWWGDPDYIEIYDNPKKWSCIYQGSCKSINELKQISKLLNIQ